MGAYTAIITATFVPVCICLCVGVQVDPSEKHLKTLTLYEMLVVLMKDEEKTARQIKESKKEVTMSPVSPGVKV